MNPGTAFSELPHVPAARTLVRSTRMRWGLATVLTLIAVGTVTLYISRPVAHVDPDGPLVVVEVKGMHCPIQCGLRVTSALESLPWVVKGSVTTNPKTGIVTFAVSDGDAVNESEVRRVVERAGFGVVAVKPR